MAAPSSDASGAAGEQTALERDILAYYQRTQPPASVLAQRAELVASLTRTVQARYGTQYVVEPFGSTLYGVSSAASDLDLTIRDLERPDGFGPDVDVEKLPYIYNPNNLAKTLAFNGFRDVQPVHASVPIVKLIDPRTRLQCDLNVNEQFGLHNSRLLRAYFDLAPHARPLLTTLKRWAKARGLNDPAGADGPTTLSSYSLALLLLAQLQAAGQLPNLQDEALLAEADVPRSGLWVRPAKRKPRRVKRKKGKADAAPAEEPAPPPPEPPRVRCDTTFSPAPPVTFTPAPLALDGATRAFFAHYADFDFEQMVVAIAAGGTVPRERPFKEEVEEKPAKKKNKGKKKDGANAPDQTPAKNEGVSEAPVAPEGDAQALRVPAQANGHGAQDSALGEHEAEIVLARLGGMGLVGDDEPATAADAPVEEMEPEEVAALEDTAETDAEDEDDVANATEGTGSSQPENWESHLIITQDPFIRPRNTSGNVHAPTARHIISELRRAHELLVAGGSLDALCAAPDKPFDGERPKRTNKVVREGALVPKQGAENSAPGGAQRDGQRARGAEGPRPSRAQTPDVSRDCFIKGIALVPDEALRTELSARFGPVRAVRRLPSGASAFVTFASIGAAQAALEASRVGDAPGGGLWLELPRAVRVRIVIDMPRPRRAGPSERHAPVAQ